MSLTYDGITYAGASPSGLIAVSSALPALCIVAVALRFNVRRTQKSRFSMDDWIMLGALILVIAMGVVAILGVEHRVWGYPELTGDDPDIAGAFEGKLLEVFQYIQIAALTLVKLSALLFYKRVFCVKDRRHFFDIMITITLVVLALWFAAMIIMNSLQCGTQIWALWTSVDAFAQYCLYVENYEIGFAISNVILDVWILILPLPKIARLHTTTTRKFAITGVFLLALAGVAGSITRMGYFIEIDEGTSNPNADYLLEDTQQVYWSNLEIGICLLAVNLPSLWAYVTKISPEAVLNSIRSAVSLQSLGSNRSRRSEARIEGAGGPYKQMSPNAEAMPKKPTEYSNDLELYDLESQERSAASISKVEV